jgi:hypothetical protein
MFPQPDRYHNALPETVREMIYDGHAEYEKASRVESPIVYWFEILLELFAHKMTFLI